MKSIDIDSFKEFVKSYSKRDDLDISFKTHNNKLVVEMILDGRVYKFERELKETNGYDIESNILAIVLEVLDENNLEN